MVVRIDPPDEQARRSKAIQALHNTWTATQLGAGVDGPVPSDRKQGSDYNQHVPALEADGDALDDLFGQLAEIGRAKPAVEEPDDEPAADAKPAPAKAAPAKATPAKRTKPKAPAGPTVDPSTVGPPNPYYSE